MGPDLARDFLAAKKNKSNQNGIELDSSPSAKSIMQSGVFFVVA